jgi:hypothetical protein
MMRLIRLSTNGFGRIIPSISTVENINATGLKADQYISTRTVVPWRSHEISLIPGMVGVISCVAHSSVNSDCKRSAKVSTTTSKWVMGENTATAYKSGAKLRNLKNLG